MRIMVGLSLVVVLSYGGIMPLASGEELDAPGNGVEILEAARTNAHASIFPWKKKKGKGSNKVKKHNRSMGKKFKRKNDDTLRR